MKYRVLEVSPDKDGEFFLQENQRLVHVLEWNDVESVLILLVTEES